MDFNTIAQVITSIANAVGNKSVQQVLTVVSYIINEWPAITAGEKSVEPYLSAVKDIMTSGTGGVSADQFDAITASLNGQLSTIAAEIAADNKA